MCPIPTSTSLCSVKTRPGMAMPSLEPLLRHGVQTLQCPMSAFDPISLALKKRFCDLQESFVASMSMDRCLSDCAFLSWESPSARCEIIFVDTARWHYRIRIGFPIQRLADVEVTSGDPTRPMEKVFLRDPFFDWRARIIDPMVDPQFSFGGREPRVSTQCPARLLSRSVEVWWYVLRR